MIRIGEYFVEFVLLVLGGFGLLFAVGVTYAPVALALREWFGLTLLGAGPRNDRLDWQR